MEKIQRKRATTFWKCMCTNNWDSFTTKPQKTIRFNRKRFMNSLFLELEAVGSVELGRMRLYTSMVKPISFCYCPPVQEWMYFDADIDGRVLEVKGGCTERASCFPMLSHYMRKKNIRHAYEKCTSSIRMLFWSDSERGCSICKDFKHIFIPLNRIEWCPKIIIICTWLMSIFNML